jgi:hypothetical protein
VSYPKRILFVTNGHGEAAIAARIAQELRSVADVRTDHFGLVGKNLGGPDFRDVGPQKEMPSGGLIVMNPGALARDIAAGLPITIAKQLGFLRSKSGARRYDAVVAVGDALACAAARFARRPLIFVGTAKSVYVERYAGYERAILRGARRIFVRDAATAGDLRAHGVDAEAPGNVIVDLNATFARVEWRAPLRLALLPGSREPAYGDAVRIAAVVAALRARRPELDAVMSIAPNLQPARFAPALELGGLRAWTGPVGALFDGATLAIGQSGTANEAAAAEGLPVVALDLASATRKAWYRGRQAGLLGDALLVVPADPEQAAAAVDELIADEPRRARMGAAGRERMGGPGGARAIARAIAELVNAE